MSDSTSTTPAGWYPQGEQLRYWDGTAWTEHTAPLQPRAPVAPPTGNSKADKEAHRQVAAEARAHAAAIKSEQRAHQDAATAAKRAEDDVAKAAKRVEHETAKAAKHEEDETAKAARRAADDAARRHS